jgi:hypothetical protein
MTIFIQGARRLGFYICAWDKSHFLNDVMNSIFAIPNNKITRRIF